MHKALFPAACHLSTTGVTTGLYRSTLRLGRTILSSSHLSSMETSPVYANFQHPECTARMSPYAWWALTPPSHPYLYYYDTGGYFLLHRPAITDSYPLGSGLSCVARTFLSFLPYKRVTSDKPDHCFFVCKFTNIP